MKENGRKDPLRFGRGRQKVTVYAPTKSLPYHRIAYWLGGKRLQRSFKDGQQAREEAKALSQKLADGAVSVADITNGQAFRYKMAEDHLAPVGTRIDVAAAEYAEACLRLGDKNLLEAVNFYVEHYGRSDKQIPISELVTGFLANKRSSGLSEAYLRDLKNRCRTLADFDCPTTVQPPHLS